MKCCHYCEILFTKCEDRYLHFHEHFCEILQNNMVILNEYNTVFCIICIIRKTHAAEPETDFSRFKELM